MDASIFDSALTFSQVEKFRVLACIGWLWEAQTSISVTFSKRSLYLYLKFEWEWNYICEPNKDNGFSLLNQNINETGALDDLDYFETLDKDIIPPYWIVAGCVLVAGVITIIAGKQEKH